MPSFALRLLSLSGKTPAHDRDGTRRHGQLALCHRPRLPLHRLDTHFCGRRRHRHIRRRQWLATVERCNDDGNRRNRQRSSADGDYLSSVHLIIRNATQLNFSAFNNRAYFEQTFGLSSTSQESSAFLFPTHEPFHVRNLSANNRIP